MHSVDNKMVESKATVDWISLGNERRIPIFYNAQCQIISELVEYALAVHQSKTDASNQGHRSAMDDAGYHLNAFEEFLEEKRLNWKRIEDADLLVFRAWLLSRTMSRRLCRSELSSKRTVNRYLRSVYHFYLWAQEVGGLITGRLGWPEAPIKSLLPTKRSHPELKLLSTNLFPACFKKCGEKSRHTFQYVASSKDIDLLLEHFFERRSVDAAERNALILLVVDCVGWRQGSMASLSIQQFDESALKYAFEKDYAWVTPKIQKFGYENSFEVPYTTVLQIHKYIQGPRAELLARKGWTESHCQGSLFINTVRGKPLSYKAITEIFSRAFKAIGAPRGSGIHSLRRKFADDKTDIEIAVRKRENRTTDPVNIGVVLKKALGHNSTQAQESYARSITRGTWDSLERVQQQRIQQLEREVVFLKSKKKNQGDSV